MSPSSATFAMCNEVHSMNLAHTTTLPKNCFFGLQAAPRAAFEILNFPSASKIAQTTADSLTSTGLDGLIPNTQNQCLKICNYS